MINVNAESVNALCAAFSKAEQWCSPDLAKMLVEYLNEGGYTIVKSEPAMSEAELEREAMALTTPFITIEKSVSLAKKYRGS